MNVWTKPLSGETSEGGGYSLMPPGEHEFTVEASTGHEYKPGPDSKIGHCAQIKLTLIIEGTDTKGKSARVKVFDNLFSDPKTEWKMTGFAKAIGSWREGITPWDLTQSAGAIGRAVLGIEKDRNGIDRNKVIRYLEPEPDPDQEPDLSPGELPF